MGSDKERASQITIDLQASQVTRVDVDIFDDNCDNRVPTCGVTDNERAVTKIRLVAGSQDTGQNVHTILLYHDPNVVLSKVSEYFKSHQLDKNTSPIIGYSECYSGTSLVHNTPDPSQVLTIKDEPFVLATLAESIKTESQAETVLTETHSNSWDCQSSLNRPQHRTGGNTQADSFTSTTDVSVYQTVQQFNYPMVVNSAISAGNSATNTLSKTADEQTTPLQISNLKNFDAPQIKQEYTTAQDCTSSILARVREEVQSASLAASYLIEVPSVPMTTAPSVPMTTAVTGAPSMHITTTRHMSACSTTRPIGVLSVPVTTTSFAGVPTTRNKVVPSVPRALAPIRRVPRVSIKTIPFVPKKRRVGMPPIPITTTPFIRAPMTAVPTIPLSLDSRVHMKMTCPTGIRSVHIAKTLQTVVPSMPITTTQHNVVPGNPLTTTQFTGSSGMPITQSELTGVPSMPITTTQFTGAPTMPMTSTKLTGVPSMPITTTQVTGAPDTPRTTSELTGAPSMPMTSIKLSGVPDMPIKTPELTGVANVPRTTSELTGVPSMPLTATQSTGAPSMPMTSSKQTRVPSMPITTTQFTGAPSMPMTSTKLTGVLSMPITTTQVTGAPDIPRTTSELTGAPSMPMTSTKLTGATSMPITTPELTGVANVPITTTHFIGVPIVPIIKASPTRSFFAPMKQNPINEPATRLQLLEAPVLPVGQKSSEATLLTQKINKELIKGTNIRFSSQKSNIILPIKNSNLGVNVPVKVTKITLPVNDEAPTKSQKQSGKTKRYKCPDCRKSFDRAMSFKQHMQVHKAVTNPYKCLICNKNHASENGFMLHSIKHPEFDGYSCDICGKRFLQEYKLDCHKQSIHGDSTKNPYLCKICMQEFTSPSLLKYHNIRFHETRAHRCNICGKDFKFENDRDRHIDFVHTGKKCHICRICGKKFATKYPLTIHMLSHTGIKPQACDICGKTFSTKGNMKNHRKLHSKEGSKVNRKNKSKHTPLPTVQLGSVDSSEIGAMSSDPPQRVDTSETDATDKAIEESIADILF